MSTSCRDEDRLLPIAAPPRRLRVMLVEDSRVVREFLSHTIRLDPRLEIVAEVDSGERALRELQHAAPDVISMDIRLPGMDGFETTRRIMMERPTPIVVVAGNVDGEDLKISINALQAGALAVLEKPVGATQESYEAFAERLCTQLAIMSQVKVVTLRNVGRRSTPPAGVRPATPKPVRRTGAPTYDMLGIVASTGGPNALVEILGRVGRDAPVPILVVQHITASFAHAFIEWLGDACGLEAVQAEDGDVPRAGRVYLPPADHHLMVRHGRLRLDRGPLMAMQRPSGDKLFHSMAESLGPRALGVILTGMGADGAHGLNAIRQAGGYTIAESESTAVVYGMPGAAVELGGVCESLPLSTIAPRIQELLRQSRCLIPE